MTSGFYSVPYMYPNENAKWFNGFILENLMIKGGSLLKVCVFIKSFLLCATILIFCSSNSFSRQQVLTTTYLDDVAPSAAIQCYQPWPKSD